MAREARKQLADLRAMEEEHERMEMRGSGKHFTGAGATPSMGLSQFRGGARKSRSHSVSEDEYEGGAIIPSTALIPYASRALARVGPRAIVPYRGATGTLATRGTRAIVPYTPRATTTALATRGTRAVVPYTPRVATTSTAATAASRGFTGLRGRIGSTLKRGLTAQNIANAIALGVPLGMLGSYLADQANASGEGGYFEDYAGEDFGGDGGAGDGGAGDGGYDDGGMGGDGGVPSDMNADELAWYLQSGNLPQRYAITTRGVKKGSRGRGKLTIEHEGGASSALMDAIARDAARKQSVIDANKHYAEVTRDTGRKANPLAVIRKAASKKEGGRVSVDYDKKKARGQAVAKIMREQGVSLPQASKMYAEMMRGKHL